MNIQGGLTGIIIGLPKTGKSWFLGTIAEVKGVESPLLLAPKPREINSFQYRKHDIPFETFKDVGWQPIIDKWDATAFRSLYRRIVDLYDDEKHDAILLDPFTDVDTIATHHILMGQKAATIDDLPGKAAKIAFFGALKDKLKKLTQALTGLADPGLKRPKHVFVAVHAQAPVAEDILGEATKEAKVKGIEYMGDVLPAVKGGYRLEIGGEFDMMMFSGLRYDNVKEKGVLRREAVYEIQVNADPSKHAGIAIIPRLEEKTIPNSMVDLFRVIEEAGG